MARYPTPLFSFLRHHRIPYKFPNFSPDSFYQIRDFTAEVETTIAIPDGKLPESSVRSLGDGDASDVPLVQRRSFEDVVDEVCGMLQNKREWESPLLTRIPSLYLSDSKFISEVLKRQTKAYLSIRFFNLLKSQSEFTPDDLSCKLLFDALVKAKAGVLAKSFIESAAFVPDSESFQGLIRLLCRDGFVGFAVDLFSKCNDYGICPSLATWNTILSESIRGGRTDLFWRLYEEMIGSGISTNAETADCLIWAFCVDDKVERGYELLRHILNDGVKPSNFVFNKLISGFCERGNFGRVSELLHLMIATDCKPSCYTYQQIINALCKKGKVREGYRVFKDLRVRGYALDIVMYTTMIHGLCDIRLVREAKKLWSEMIEKGLTPNEYAYNAMIHGLCKTGDIEMVQEMHKEMCESGYKETTVSYNTLIAGMCKNKKTEEACRLFVEMSQKGLSRDVITYNSLIRGLCRVGNVDKSEEFFLKLLEQGLQPSLSSYMPLVREYCKAGKMDRAMELWKDMDDRGVKPSNFSFECIILGFCKQGCAVEGMHWLSEMLEGKLIPNQRTFEILLQCLLEKDEIDDALLILGSMLDVGYPLTKHVTESLVSKVCVDSFQHVEASLEKIFERTYL